MTSEDKKRKRYLAAVRRRLDLPKDLKDRVMSDFECSIQARQEAGMSEEAIFAELGMPRHAAAELNEQMKAFTYRKSPWRFLFAGCAAYGAAKILGAVWVNLICLFVGMWDRLSADTMAVSIGVIGGADGPTAIFVTTPPWVHYLVPLALLILGIWGFLPLSRCKRK